MITKSLYIVGALAGALVFSAAAQAAPGQVTGNVHLIAARAHHFYEPAWLYDHTTDQNKPDVVDHDGEGMHDGVVSSTSSGMGHRSGGGGETQGGGGGGHSGGGGGRR